MTSANRFDQERDEANDPLRRVRTTQEQVSHLNRSGSRGSRGGYDNFSQLNQSGFSQRTFEMPKSDPAKVSEFNREFRESLRICKQKSQGLYLSDLLEQLRFIPPSLKSSGVESRLSIMLRQQRANFQVPDNEDFVKNLFNVCCSILNILPIQRGYN